MGGLPLFGTKSYVVVDQTIMTSRLNETMDGKCLKNGREAMEA